MKIIKPSFEILEMADGIEILKRIERAGRVCYKSEDKITNDSCKTFVSGIIRSGHESVIEHEKASVLFTCDRGVSHEVVRHRIASYSQESTRYCNYGNGKFGNEITVILIPFWDEKDEKFQIWLETMNYIEKQYLRLIALGAQAQEARAVLPNSLKTDIVCTFNMREWRHFFKLRTSKAAHRQIREIAEPLLKEFQRRIPVLFDDINA